MKIALIIPAAGVGKRFADGSESSKNKLELELNDKAVLLRSLDVFFRRSDIAQTIVAVHPDRVDAFRMRFGDKLAFHGVEIVPGGTVERWETVSKALAAVRDECTHVAVHDAVRPLTSDALVQRVFEAAQKHAAVIPGIPASATLKRGVDVNPADSEGDADPLDAILGDSGPKVALKRVTETLDRRGVYEIQTPQLFERSLLQRAYENLPAVQAAGEAITDDAGLVEALGEPVYIVEGESTNLKITRPEDARIAEALLRFHDEQTAASLGRKRLFGDEDDDL